jgi:hypothetical protein
VETDSDGTLWSSYNVAMVGDVRNLAYFQLFTVLGLASGCLVGLGDAFISRVDIAVPSW